MGPPSSFSVGGAPYPLPFLIVVTLPPVLSGPDARRHRKIHNARRGLERAGPLIRLFQHVPCGKEPMPPQHTKLVLDQGLTQQFSHLQRAHRLLSSHHRYAMEEVGTLRVQRDDLVPVQRQHDAMWRMSVDNRLSSSTAIDCAMD